MRRFVLLILWSLLVPAPVSGQTLLDDLVAYWSLEEASGNAIDAHGSNDLTDTNTVGAGTGKVNGARDFEHGSTEYFEIGDNTDLSMGDIDMTMALWVQFESAATYDIVGKGGAEYLGWFDAANQLRFRINSADRVSKAFTPTLATWYFLVFYHDAVNNVVGISVDAGAATTASYSSGIADGSGPFDIGTSAADTSFSFDGLIDEVGVWKRLLSPAEKTELYNAGAGLAYPFGVASATSGTAPSLGSWLGSVFVE